MKLEIGSGGGGPRVYGDFNGVFGRFRALCRIRRPGRAGTCADMPGHARACVGMRGHARACMGMRGHARACTGMRGHARVCAGMRGLQCWDMLILLRGRLGKRRLYNTQCCTEHMCSELTLATYSIIYSKRQSRNTQGMNGSNEHFGAHSVHPTAHRP